MSLVLNAIASLAFVLQVAFLFLLVSGGFWKFPLLSVYCVFQYLTGLAEFSVKRQFGTAGALYARLYWTDEIVLDLLLFLMVIAFTLQALEGSPVRAKAKRFLTGVVVIAVVAPFVLYYQREIFSTPWFNRTSQFLNFAAAIMNLALWTALLFNKKRDPQLLTVSIGLGVAVTGAALHFGLRQLLSPGLRPFSTLVGSLTHLAGVFVWCWAFRPTFLREKPKSTTGPLPAQTSPAATPSGY
jgi:hypothetical protein